MTHIQHFIYVCLLIVEPTVQQFHTVSRRVARLEVASLLSVSQFALCERYARAAI
ncbi:hypothetical protein B7L88_gp098 [Rhizobium phage RHEph10]|uniref:hypothetical protein n=1 Tax=Rhizobium phage RHEph10 TaxID=1220717 RepID=UPI0002AAF876|nr:hypothetical protein B7L88_gp098 [Rhizobium phage RHEph10]AGC36190.1 hypothetical protein RHEph10_gp147 [Rhizobium phage RHEph10]